VNERTSYVNRDDWAVIANISDQEFHSDQAGLGLYTLPACPAGEPYTRTRVYGRTELYDMGDDRKGERYWSARLIAKSVVAEHNPDADLRRYGVFLCAGDEPLEDELREAAARRDAYFREQVEQADALYARAPNRPELISDVQRRAARHLGLDRPWLVKIAPMQECPVCGEALKAGVAVCRYCGAVLDEEKAARYRVAAARSISGASAEPTLPAAAELAASAPGATPARGHDRSRRLWANGPVRG
jgi:predicted nucleic acid-binding Zn ribbon protein